MQQYTPHNQETLIRQLPEATDVRSRTEWLKAGRIPAKGSKALRVSVPKTHTDPTTGEVTVTFRGGPVFDISQTVPSKFPKS